MRRYIDTDSSHTYTDDNLIQVLKKAEHQRVMLIFDTAGMAKSTAKKHLSNIIKRTSPAKWVVRIDLNDHTDTLKALKEQQIDSKKAINVVSERLLKLKTWFRVGII
jgi:tRNA uridine 5-carbamoylmethylation protein Kti12